MVCRLRASPQSVFKRGINIDRRATISSCADTRAERTPTARRSLDHWTFERSFGRGFWKGWRRDCCDGAVFFIRITICTLSHPYITAYLLSYERIHAHTYREMWGRDGTLYAVVNALGGHCRLHPSRMLYGCCRTVWGFDHMQRPVCVCVRSVPELKRSIAIVRILWKVSL